MLLGSPLLAVAGELWHSFSMDKQSEKKLRERAAKVSEALRERYPVPPVNLVAENPWQLLVATILSAQCTDKRVNAQTPLLFARWPGPMELAAAQQEELEEVIRPCGFYHAKASNLLATAKRVVTVYQGSVPQSLTELMTLPGVARKTANVVLSGAFGLHEGIAVDTHVKRISFRLGLTASKNPLHIEKDLMRLIKQDEWGLFNHRMVWFGREVCTARGPRCNDCPMTSFCAKIEIGSHEQKSV